MDAALAGSAGTLVEKQAGQTSGRKPNLADLQRLAEFRYQLRRFLHFSQQAAEAAGLRAQQHQLLLTICGMPNGAEPTIANVAARMFLKHNSTVELVDRAIEQGLLRRVHDPVDHRRIFLRLTPQGEELLRSLAAFHLEELENAGPELIRSLKSVLAESGRLGAARRKGAE